MRKHVRPRAEPLEDRSLPSGTPFTTQPILPAIDAAMATHLEAVLQLGEILGNQPDVFIKVGDSISANPYFLVPLGTPTYNPRNPSVAGSYTGLAATIDYFRSQTVDGTGANSFNHVGVAEHAGWMSFSVLDPSLNPPSTPGSGIVPSLSPLENEIRLTHPSIALIMLGTNDISFNVPAGTFENNLLQIGQLALRDGVIPVFSSVPNHPYGGPGNVTRMYQFNQIISNVATALDVPFWNYWAALQSLPNAGLSADSVHPSVYPGGAGYLTTPALNYGFNMRNLTAVEVLQELKYTVIGSAASGRSVVLTPEDATYVQNLYVSLLGRSATDSEVSAWEQVLLEGGTRMDIALGIWQAPEHYVRELTQDYETILNREPSARETASWVAALQGGTPEEQVLAQFLSSPEYVAGHATPDAQIAGIYQDVLNRAPQPDELAMWENQIHKGAKLNQIALTIVTSPEGYQDTIDAFYVTFLNRTATSQDHAIWLGWLESGPFTLADLGQNILASYEYFIQPPLP
jgi:hypothetical protein